MKALHGLVGQNGSRNTIKTILKTVISLFFLTVLQTTLIESVSVFHTIPSLPTVFLVCFCVQKGDVTAILISAIYGLFLELVSAGTTEHYGILYLYISVGCVYLHNCLYERSLLTTMLIVFFASLMYTAAYFLFNFLIWGNTMFGYAFLYKMLPEALYNTLTTPLLYPLVRMCIGVRRGVYRV